MKHLSSALVFIAGMVCACYMRTQQDGAFAFVVFAISFIFALALLGQKETKKAVE